MYIMFLLVKVKNNNDNFVSNYLSGILRFYLFLNHL